MAAKDKRRRQWVPIYSDYPKDPVALRLSETFGISGLVIWIALQTAAKRALNQGEVVLGSSDAEAWAVLGLEVFAAEFGFSIRDFLAVTGDLKQTRKRTYGGVLYVELTHFEELNQAPRTGSGRKQIPRSASLESAPDIENSTPGAEADSDSEIDSDIDKTHRESAFQSFHLHRMRGEVRKLEQRGKEIQNPEGYARALAQDLDQLTESRRVWTHRECRRCEGTGVIRTYSPGSGGGTAPCGETGSLNQ